MSYGVFRRYPVQLRRKPNRWLHILGFPYKILTYSIKLNGVTTNSFIVNGVSTNSFTVNGVTTNSFIVNVSE